jgi:predicted Zn finger-like uncharacterized protein
MNEIITCPSCKRTLQIDESMLGETVQCPHCSHTFMPSTTSISAEPKSAPGSIASGSAPDDAEEPRRRRYDEEDELDDTDVNIRRRAGEVPNYLVQSILVTLCCCWPFGIVAIINAAKVNSLLASGDYDGAVRASDAAQKWCWIAFVLGLIVNVLYVVLQLAGTSL